MSTEKFELRLPTIEPKPGISMSQISREGLAAMSRKVAGPSTAERLAKLHSLEDYGLSEKTRQWAEEKLFSAAEKWQKYNDILEIKMPMDSYGLGVIFPELGLLLTKLHETVENDSRPNENPKSY